MKTRFLLVLAALLSGPAASATTYYFAASGNDANTAAQAQNPATPWQSLAKLNAVMGQLQAGDQVLFRRGDTFRGVLTITRSGSNGAPLTFAAYGPAGNPAPVLSGSAPLSGWVGAGANLWEAPCPSCGPVVTGVYGPSGRALPLGRYPNASAPGKGYLVINAHAGNNQLTSAALGGSWAGATAVVRSERWILDRLPVTSQSGPTLTLGAPENGSGYGLKDGWGFFLQSHPATLDQPGEWYYDANAKKIRLFAPTRPADGAIEATTAAPASVVIRGQRYVTLENLTLAHALSFGLDAESASNLTVRGVAVLGAGENGVRLNGVGAGVLFENNLIKDTNNNGMSVSGYSDCTFRGNTLRNTGVVAGRGLGGEGQYFTFNVMSGNNLLLQGNTLDSCGYVGLAYFASNNVTIEQNVVSNFDLTKDDGGGIYTWNGSSPPTNNVNAKIINNLVLNAVGAAEGTNNPAYIPGHGIYLDDCSQNVEVAGNTVAYCRSSGIFLHGANRVVVRGNTCFGNQQQLLLAPSTNSCLFSALDIRDNVLATSRAADGVARYETAANDLATLGTFTNNHYVRPFDDLLKIGTSYRTAPGGPSTGAYVNTSYNLVDWQAAFGQDAGSRDSPVRFRPYRVDARVGNNLVTNSQFTTGTGNWTTFTAAGNGRLSWDNANRLGSGGSLRLNFAGSSGQVGQFMTTETLLGPIRQAKRYAVRFRAACATGSKVVEVYLKRGATNYADLAPRTTVLLTPTATDFEVTFVPTTDDPTANLAFTVGEDANQEWFDNVDLREATLTAASVADSVRFEYNATASARTVALPAGARYLDARNVAYGGSLTLAPYASVVLLRLNGAGTPLAAKPMGLQTRAVHRLWPNPTAGPATLDLQDLPAGAYRITVLDALGQAVRRLVLPAGRPHALNLTGLAPGVFLLRIEGAGGPLVQRFVRE